MWGWCEYSVEKRRLPEDRDGVEYEGGPEVDIGKGMHKVKTRGGWHEVRTRERMTQRQTKSGAYEYIHTCAESYSHSSMSC